MSTGTTCYFCGVDMTEWELDEMPGTVFGHPVCEECTLDAEDHEALTGEQVLD